MEIRPWVDNPENKKLLPCPPWNRTVYAYNEPQSGPNYTTASIAGPNELVLGGIQQVMQDLPSQIIPIEDWIAHHRKRGVVLQGSDGRLIDWLWCLSTWDKLGRPVVYAAPGDPFYNLSLYMYPEKISPRQLQGIVAWLKEHFGESQK